VRIRLSDYSILAHAGDWIARGLVVLAIFTTVFAARENPNIVLILTDDQGYGDASSYWPETDLKTPVMERIAAQGIKFNQFRVNPLCAPTRASIITGTYSIYNGMWRDDVLFVFAFINLSNEVNGWPQICP